MEFFRQEYWIGLPFPSPGDLPHSGTELRSPELQARFFTLWATREAQWSGSVQFSLVAQSCSTLCDPMDCSMPGFPVHHQLPEFTQTHVHWVSDVIQPSHPLLSPSPAFNLSQHQGLFKWVRSSPSGGQSIRVSASASVLSTHIQDWFPLGWTGWISLLSKGLSRVFFSTTVQKHHFFGT